MRGVEVVCAAHPHCVRHSGRKHNGGGMNTTKKKTTKLKFAFQLKIR